MWDARSRYDGKWAVTGADDNAWDRVRGVAPPRFSIEQFVNVRRLHAFEISGRKAAR